MAAVQGQIHQVVPRVLPKKVIMFQGWTESNHEFPWGLLSKMRYQMHLGPISFRQTRFQSGLNEI